MGQKVDTRAIGLDVGLSFMKWLTGAENLHYGLWDGLACTAENLGAAQAAYTDKLFSYLPEGPLRILDIGGGAGETARKLIALGHEVEIVVPSPFLASRCRQNASEARVHQCFFEEFSGAGGFDLCLFSESFQYIPHELALEEAFGLLKPSGQVLIADCFRSEHYEGVKRSQTVGGGHRLAAMRKTVAAMDLTVEAEEDITEAVAPSIDLEQGLFNVIGHAVSRVDEELKLKRPKTRWTLAFAIKRMVSERRLFRLNERLNEQKRTAEAFCHFNRYMIMRLSR
ncbi:class I SAM-dependent methyltransferase [Vannielia litorea]|uniref:class I SAM-dependent methyltransferase n=1 Tax=Vannielia litorea TaxID=1217970 RepID=UPI001C95881A|nr:class I SAM-dependent methyltransferase [Vannielia litorea]MBY6049160.1 class I SAM-dependent methyltransferase [Vannielia litorea]MBY6076574.1 class I SAM-dependent methyltransferase [Vannielia litorea]